MLGDAGRHLGVAVAGLVNLVNPEVIILGGQLSKVGSIITDPMLAALERCAIPSAAASVTLRRPELDATPTWWALSPWRRRGRPRQRA